MAKCRGRFKNTQDSNNVCSLSAVCAQSRIADSKTRVQVVLCSQTSLTMLACFLYVESRNSKREKQDCWVTNLFEFDMEHTRQEEHQQRKNITQCFSIPCLGRWRQSRPAASSWHVDVLPDYTTRKRENCCLSHSQQRWKSLLETGSHDRSDLEI